MKQWRTTPEAVRERLRQWLAEEGWSARRLALATEQRVPNVQRWVSGREGAGEVSAELVGRMEELGLAAARWILIGDGPMKPIKPGQAERRLEITRRLLALGLRIATDPEMEELAAFLETIPMEVEALDPQSDPVEPVQQ